MIFPDEPDSESETEGADLEGCRLIVDWESILPLLLKCQEIGCPDQVLPSNIKISIQGDIE